MKVGQFLFEQVQPARMRKTALPLALLALAVVLASSARAEMSKEELAKLAQNPMANLISVPFQNNTNFNYGPLDERRTS